MLGMNADVSANESAEEEEQLSGGEVALSLVVALGLFVLLFIVLPNVIVAFIQRRISSIVLVNLIEVRPGGDIHRVHGYLADARHSSASSRITVQNTRRSLHGEAGEALTVENARRHGRPMHAAARTSCS